MTIEEFVSSLNNEQLVCLSNYLDYSQQGSGLIDSAIDLWEMLTLIQDHRGIY